MRRLASLSHQQQQRAASAILSTHLASLSRHSFHRIMSSSLSETGGNNAQADADTDAAGVKKSLIYTRTGDKGTTSLYTGARRPKDDVIFDALGGVDELNAHLGLAIEFCTQADNGLQDRLKFVQSRLLDLGSCIATPVPETKSEQKLQRVQFDEAHLESLEKWIDMLDSTLPPLRAFILPSGGLASSQLHICRTVCRRAERCVVPLVRDGQTPDIVQRYLNRLSDFLFVAARFAAKHEGKQETIWSK